MPTFPTMPTYLLTVSTKPTTPTTPNKSTMLTKSTMVTKHATLAWPTGAFQGRALEIIACVPQARNVLPQARIVPQKEVSGPVPRAGISRLCPPPNHCLCPQKWVKFLFRTKNAGQIEWTSFSSLRFLQRRHFFLFLFWSIIPNLRARTEFHTKGPFVPPCPPPGKRRTPPGENCAWNERNRLGVMWKGGGFAIKTFFLSLVLNPDFEGKITLHPSKNCLYPKSAQHWRRAYYRYYAY